MDTEALIATLSPKQQEVVNVIRDCYRISRQALMEKTGILSNHMSREVQPAIDLGLVGYGKDGRSVIYTWEGNGGELSPEPDPLAELASITLAKPIIKKVRTSQRDIIKDYIVKQGRPVFRQEICQFTGTTCSNINTLLEPYFNTGELRKDRQGNQVYYEATGQAIQTEPLLTETDQAIEKIPTLKAFLMYRADEAGSSDKSVEQFAFNIVDFYRFLDPTLTRIRSLEMITTSDIRRYNRHLKDERKISDGARKNTLEKLRSYFKWCVRQDFLKIDPTAKMDFPKQITPEQVDLNPDEIEQLDDVATDPLKKLLLHWLLFTGMRASEVEHCEVAHLRDLDNPDPEMPHVFIPGDETKNKEARPIPLEPDLLKLLKAYLDTMRKPKDPEEIALFLNSRGEPLRYNSILRYIKELGESAGLTKIVKPHALRRTFGRQLYENGIALRAIQRLLGHKDIATTIRYVKATEKFVRTQFHKASALLISKIWHRKSQNPIKQRKEPTPEPTELPHQYTEPRGH